MNSQRLEHHAQGLHGPTSGPLCMYYGCQLVVFEGLLRVGAGAPLVYLAFLEHFPSCWVALSNFDMIVFASSYYILFCHVWLLSLRSLFLNPIIRICCVSKGVFSVKKEKEIKSFPSFHCFLSFFLLIFLSPSPTFL